MYTFTLRFNVSAGICQHVEIEDKYVHLFTEEQMKAGNVLTTLGTSGNIYYIGNKSFLTIGKITCQETDAACLNEYTDFRILKAGSEEDDKEDDKEEEY